MAITNHERVGKAMELLKGGLGPLSSASSRMHSRIRRRRGRPLLGDDRLNAKTAAWRAWDVAALLKLMWECLERRLPPDARARRAVAGERAARVIATSGRTRSRSPATTPTARSTRWRGC